VWGGGGSGEGRRGKETKGHPRIVSIAVKGQAIHTWSDRASNYLVSVEDDIKPGSIPGNTIILDPFGQFMLNFSKYSPFKGVRGG
jgi:hypothetical protein